MPDVGPGPFGERIDLGAALAIVLAERDLGAVGALLPAQAGDPGAAAGEHARQRLELAHAAAGLAQLDAAVHRLLTVGADEVEDLLADRREDLDRQAVVRLDARDQRERLGVQLAGVERGQRDGQAVPGDQVGDDHVLDTQRGRLQRAGTEVGGGLLQHLDRAREALVEASGLAGVQADRGADAGAGQRGHAGCGRVIAAARREVQRGQLAAHAQASAFWLVTPARANSGRVSLTSAW